MTMQEIVLLAVLEKLLLPQDILGPFANECIFP
jgi:hypothetical protein